MLVCFSGGWTEHGREVGLAQKSVKEGSIKGGRGETRRFVRRKVFTGLQCPYKEGRGDDDNDH